MKAKILIIDDDEKLNDLLVDYFAKFDLQVFSAIHPKEGFKLLTNEKPDLVILDVMLPDMDGFEICKEIRKESNIPIIMLTARGDITDKVVGLEIGADDYLAKPFEPRELVARIQSVLRRSGEKKETKLLQFGALTINTANHEVKLGDMIIDLTSAEYELLTLFTKNQGSVLSRDEIMDRVRGIEWESFDRSVDVLVSRLRHKLHDDPKHPNYLKTVWGTGYLFLESSQS
ncbi:MAG: response regulator transcription factor [Proteobacteria bacterium]|nr:response regulator transcription factor [Pseudomonadota bacterium]